MSRYYTTNDSVTVFLEIYIYTMKFIRVNDRIKCLANLHNTVNDSFHSRGDVHKVVNGCRKVKTDVHTSVNGSFESETDIHTSVNVLNEIIHRKNDGNSLILKYKP